jgi:hypothetical protein
MATETKIIETGGASFRMVLDISEDYVLSLTLTQLSGPTVPHEIMDQWAEEMIDHYYEHLPWYIDQAAEDLRRETVQKRLFYGLLGLAVGWAAYVAMILFQR